MRAAFTLAIGISLAFGGALLRAEDTVPPATQSDFCKSINRQPDCHLKILTPPRLIQVVRPDYPMNGRKKKRGLVRLQATITTTGEVRDLKVERGGREIAQAALEAVKQWRYKPSTVNGVPVEQQHEISVDFTPDNGITLGADEMFPDLPTEPAEDLIAMLRSGDLFFDGDGVKPPKPVYSPDPEYSQTARSSRYEGKCLLMMIVGNDGLTGSVWVQQPLGYGLDERAVATVRQWKFMPATKNGKPVAVLINVEVQFRLN